MSFQDGGPAFPVADYDHMVFQPATVAETKRDLSGMSLRDYFASQALTGLIGTYVVGNGTCMGTEHFAKNVSTHAYKLADAMLAARSA